ncbi:hypothetical protein F4680DRAFT_102687 [Xylaria scruposa]|nr:hypothetical protein F4680DRAFT_102687 [Xylaria scruposa]
MGGVSGIFGGHHGKQSVSFSSWLLAVLACLHRSRGKILVTRMLANQGVTVVKLLQRPINRQMHLHPHIVLRPLTHTARLLIIRPLTNIVRLHIILPQASMVHHPTHPRQDNMVSHHTLKADRILPMEVVDRHQITDIVQLHTNIVSHSALG